MSAPSMGAHPIVFADETLWLLPERAVWWPAQQVMMVADIHLGKGASYRALGQPVPTGTTHDTLNALSELVMRYDVQHLTVLGDLIHDPGVLQPDRVRQIMAWRHAQPPLSITLILGNHERGHQDWPDGLLQHVVHEPYAWTDQSRLRACHHPQVLPGLGAIAGHLHPVVHLQGQGDRLRLPCFVQTPETLILPSFGAFTGGHRPPDTPGAQYFAVGAGRVWALPSDA